MAKQPQGCKEDPDCQAACPSDRFAITQGKHQVTTAKTLSHSKMAVGLSELKNIALSPKSFTILNSKSVQ